MVTIRVSIFVVITDYLRRLLYTLKNCKHSEPNGLSAAYTFVTLLQLRFSGWINSFRFGQVHRSLCACELYGANLELISREYLHQFKVKRRVVLKIQLSLFLNLKLA